MSTKKSKIAVIGLGNVGKVVAANLVKGNRQVIVATKTIEDATTIAKELGSLATAMDVGAAIKAADIIVLAVLFSTIKEFAVKFSAQLEGKIVIDPSNPIAPDGSGGFKKIIGEKESAGQTIAAILPKSVKLAKALGSLSAGSLASAARKKPEAAVLFYATDDDAINRKIEELIKDSGFEPLHIGKIDQSIRIEVFGDLHEFGGLGKTISVADANARI